MQDHQKQIQLTSIREINMSKKIVIYRLICNTCNRAYIGQTGRTITIRFNEVIRRIKTNNPQSAFALYILNNGHE